MRSPRFLLVLATLLLPLALLATLLPSANAAPSAPIAEGRAAAVAPSPRVLQAKVKPSQDYPGMPRKCATHAEKIPSKPIICKLNRFDRTRPTIVLWGDSHAWMFIPTLKKAVRGYDINLVASLMGSCPPMDNNLASDKVPACLKSNDLALKYVLHQAKRKQDLLVLLGSSWQRYLHALKVGDRETYVGQMSRYFRTGTPRLFTTLKRAGVRTDVIGQVATVPEKRNACRAGNQPYSCNVSRGRALPEFGSTRRWLKTKMKPLGRQARLIDVNPYFCSSKVCHGLVKREHTWFDDFHLSATMSRHLVGYITGSVKRVDTTPPAPSNPGGPAPCPIPLLCG